MANICSFSMRIKGSKENVKIFLDCLEQKGKYGDHELVWVGRGCELNIGIEDYDEETQTLFTEGWCKWSMGPRSEVWDFLVKSVVVKAGECAVLR